MKEMVNKKDVLNTLIELRTTHMYNSHLYQGIELAIEEVEKIKGSEVENDK